MVGVLHEVHSLALRVLLHGGSSDEEETDADHAGEEEEHTDDDTKSLRIAAIFIILAAGIVGALPCLFFPVSGPSDERWSEARSAWRPPRWVRARKACGRGQLQGLARTPGGGGASRDHERRQA